jgi:hypothetical protein
VKQKQSRMTWLRQINSKAILVTWRPIGLGDVGHLTFLTQSDNRWRWGQPYVLATLYPLAWYLRFNYIRILVESRGTRRAEKLGKLHNILTSLSIEPSTIRDKYIAILFSKVMMGNVYIIYNASLVSTALPIPGCNLLQCIRLYA